MKERLRQPASWGAWWRERVPFEEKAAIVVLGLGGLMVGGWLLADNLSSASAGVGQTTQAEAIRTVDEHVTVRDRAKPVTTRVPVVKRVYVTRKGSTPASTVVRTETTYGTSTVVVPTYVTHVVTAPARTVTDTQVVTTTRVTTTVQWRVITVVEKSPPVTVTVTTSGQ